MQHRVLFALIAAAAVALGTTQASASVLYSQTWGTDTATTAATTSTYTDFTLNQDDATVSGGVLTLSGATEGGSQTTFKLNQTFAGDIVIDGWVGGVDEGQAGSLQVGIMLGNDPIIFHPGFPGGAARMEVPNWQNVGSMGFDPAGDGTLYHMIISVDTAASTADVSVTDGVTTFTHQYTYDSFGYVPGVDTIGFYRMNGGSIDGDATFGALTISDVPEPGTLALLLAAGMGLAIWARRRTK